MSSTSQASTQSSAILVEPDTSRNGETMDPDQHRAWRKISGKDTGENWCMFEAVVPSRHGVPLHLHQSQDEWFWILRGQFDVEVGGELYCLKPGASILAPRNIPHRWTNRDASTGRLLVMAQPAASMEKFFDELYALAPKDYDDMAQIVSLFEQNEMKVLGPPLEGTQF